MEARERRGSYAGSREKQIEFEEQVEEEDGDWQAAVDDVAEHRKPKAPPDEPASSGL